MTRAPRAVFGALATIDIIQRVDRLPGPNAKATASRQEIIAGGPALNAAVTFAALGGQATLVTALGTGPFGALVADELAALGVTVIDAAQPTFAPPVSSITVDDAGNRQIVSTDSRGRADQAQFGDLGTLDEAVAVADAVEIDGHHPRLCVRLAERAAVAGLPVVADAGRWRPVFGEVAHTISDLVASADFTLPSPSPRFDHPGFRHVVTHGADDITWDGGNYRPGPVAVVDTSGAGDVFHGAYCFARAAGAPLGDIVAFASAVAGLKCRSFGTRAWLADLPHAAAGWAARWSTIPLADR